ncbi:hypothetical protein OK016_05350 [Vibrio chagasii]|nr:hypothetical protein [Vibrio chagasii]
MIRVNDGLSRDGAKLAVLMMPVWGVSCFSNKAKHITLMRPRGIYSVPDDAGADASSLEAATMTWRTAVSRAWW